MKTLIFALTVAFSSSLVFAQTSVSFSGKIDEYSLQGLERRIIKAISKIKPDKPRVIVINLDSGGGDLQKANRFVQTARSLEVTHNVTINTKVSSWASCESACTVLFTAGTERLAGHRASFGFHTPKVESRLPRGVKEEEILTMARRLWINAIARVDHQVASLVESRGYLFDEEMQYLEADQLDTGYVTAIK